LVLLEPWSATPNYALIWDEAGVEGTARTARSRRPAGENALDPDAPEVVTMLDEFIRDCEAKWLDEPIPALDDHTPRQPADDPTLARRPDQTPGQLPRR
jgi:hypothetical protein